VCGLYLQPLPCIILSVALLFLGFKIFTFGRRSQYIDPNVYMFDTVLCRWSSFVLPSLPSSALGSVSDAAVCVGEPDESSCDELDDLNAGRMGQVACLVDNHVWLFGGISNKLVPQGSCSFGEAVNCCGADGPLSVPDERHCTSNSFHAVDVLDLQRMFTTQHVQQLPDPLDADVPEEFESLDALLAREKAALAREQGDTQDDLLEESINGADESTRGITCQLCALQEVVSE
jgi:hypothetical protein